MYTIKTTVQPTSEPVTVSDVKKRLRTNVTDEDDLIPGFIASARLAFESLTQRAVLTSTIRQYVSTISNGITLMRGPIQSITGVYYYDSNNVLQTSSTHRSDINSVPGRIWWSDTPNVSTTVSPPAYVDYVCGWTDASEVPQDVKHAIALLAATYFDYRSAWVTDSLHEVPLGFRAIAARYALCLDGSWGN